MLQELSKVHAVLKIAVPIMHNVEHSHDEDDEAGDRAMNGNCNSTEKTQDLAPTASIPAPSKSQHKKANGVRPSTVITNAGTTAKPMSPPLPSVVAETCLHSHMSGVPAESSSGKDTNESVSCASACSASLHRTTHPVAESDRCDLSSSLSLSSQSEGKSNAHAINLVSLATPSVFALTNHHDSSSATTKTDHDRQLSASLSVAPESSYQQALVPLLPRGGPLSAALPLSPTVPQHVHLLPMSNGKRKDPPSSSTHAMEACVANPQSAAAGASAPAAQASQFANNASTSIPLHPSPVSRRDSLPLDVRNKKMKPTDCLLFAATLLESDGPDTTKEEGKKLDVTTDDGSAFVNKALSGNGIHLIATSNETQSLTPQIALAPKVTSSVRVPSTGVHTAVQTQSPAPVAPVAREPVKHSPQATKQLIQALAISSLAQALPIPSNQDIKESSNETSTSRDDRRPKSATSTLSSIPKLYEPKSIDVLCGRGGKVNQHPGNIIFRRVVAHNKAYYQSVHKRNRILVSQSIVQAILNYGGQFLTQIARTNVWMPVDFKKAVQKTSQALREFKREPGEKEEVAM